MNKLMFLFSIYTDFFLNKCFLCCIVLLNFVINVNKIDCSIVVVVIVSKIE